MIDNDVVDREVTERLRTWGQGLPSHIADAFRALDQRLELLTERQPGYFFHPFAFPIVHLPIWVAAWGERQGTKTPPDALLNAVEAAVLGYLHVRVQDDLIDEGIGEPGPAMLLAEALHVRHTTLLARISEGAEEFWDLFERTWTDYGEAMLLESTLHRAEATYGAAEFDLVLVRSHPLILPPAALLYRLNAADKLPALREWVRLLSRAHQLMNDALDAEGDLKNGNHTWVVRRFGGLESPDRLRANLHHRGGFDTIIDEISADLDAADAVLRGSGLHEASEHVASRRAWMTRIQTSLRKRAEAARHQPSSETA